MQITFRSITKFAVKTTVGVATSEAIDYAAEATLDIDTETIPFQVGSIVAGAVVAEKLSPRTDAAVDFVADRVPLPKRKSRKTTPETTRS